MALSHWQADFGVCMCFYFRAGFEKGLFPKNTVNGRFAPCSKGSEDERLVENARYIKAALNGNTEAREYAKASQVW